MSRVRVAALLASVLLVPTVLVAPASAQQRGVDTTYERVDTVGKHILLFTGNGRSYRMTKKTHAKHKALWMFLKKGKKIHLTIEKRWVLKISRGWKTKSTRSARILVEIRKCTEGDRVVVDGLEYLFIKADDKHVKLSPKGASGYEGEETLRIDRIKTFVLAPKVETGPVAQDTLQIFGVRKGDTVRLHLGRKSYVGGVYELTDKVVMLLEFTRGHWAKRPRRFLRGEVTKVRHLPLSWTRAFELKGGGAITIKTQLFRRGAENRPLELKMEVSHDHKGGVLSDLTLRIGLSERVGGAHTADAEQIVPVRSLFPGDVQKVTKEAIHTRYVDAQPKPEGYRVLPYSDRDAKPHIVRTIDLGGMDTAMLRRLYLGAGKSLDPDFLRYFMSVILFPSSKAGLKPKQHADLAREGLQAGGLAAATALVEDITADDKGLQLTSISKGRLIREDLPDGMEPDEVRKKLIAELAKIPGALAGSLGGKLFDYYCGHPSLREALESAFSKQSKEVMGQLFKVAIPAGKGVDPTRVKAANELIRSLGPESIQWLQRELTTRNVNVDRLKKAREQHGQAQASKVLAVALELAKEWQKGKQATFRDQGVNAALALAEEDTSKALAAIRKILAEDPRHALAKKAFPTLLLRHAESLSKAGDTGAAGSLYEEALELTPKAAPPLAKLLLATLREDLTGVILRGSPHSAAPLIAKATAGQLFDGSARKDGWVEVQSSKGTAYVRANSIEAKSATKFMAVLEVPPAGVFEGGTKEIKKLDPSLAVKADEILGSYYAQLAEKKFKAGKYSEVGPLLDQAAKLAPNDPRLGLASQAWLRANLWLLIGLLVVIVLGAVAGSIVYKKIQKEKEKEQASGDQSLKITLFTDAMDAGVTAEEDLAREGPLDLGIPPGEA